MKSLKDAFAFVSTWWKLGVAIIAACSACFILGQCEGRGAERDRWEARAAKAQADSEERARAADAQRRDEVGAIGAAINQAREELDNATRNLPDESPSARRRARFCAELREQARAGGTAPPAC